MIIDWRSLRYRGGSGYFGKGFAQAYVGLTVDVAPVPDFVIYDTVVVATPSFADAAVATPSFANVTVEPAS